MDYLNFVIKIILSTTNLLQCILPLFGIQIEIEVARNLAFHITKIRIMKSAKKSFPNGWSIFYIEKKLPSIIGV
jgi:hypothetical protein